MATVETDSGVTNQEGRPDTSNDTVPLIPPAPEPDRSFYVSVEPLVFAVYFSMSLSDSILTQLYLKQTCLVQLQLNSSVCATLGTDTDEGRWAEAHVQPVAADYLMWKMILQCIVPAVLSLFLGPWTDIYGRKPVLVFSATGLSLMYVVYILLAYVPNLHPAYLLLGVIPLSCMGGYVNLISVAYCYISDINTSKQRPFRLGILQAVLFFGILAGLFTSPYLFNGAETWGFGYLVIFAVAGFTCFIATAFLVYYVPESVSNAQSSEGGTILSLSLPMEMFRTCFRQRGQHKRTVLVLCMLILGITVMVQEGEAQVTYLYTRIRFGWTLQNFSVYASIFIAMTIAGISLLGLLKNTLGVSDFVVLLLMAVGNIGQCVTTAVAKHDQSYLMYVAGVLAVLRGLCDPVIKSIMSFAVAPSDLGKVFALTAVLQSVMPIAASSMYVTVYDASISKMPAGFFLLSAAFHKLTLIFVIVIGVIQKRYWRDPPAEIVQ